MSFSPSDVETFEAKYFKVLIEIIVFPNILVRVFYLFSAHAVSEFQKLLKVRKKRQIFIFYGKSEIEVVLGLLQKAIKV